MKVIFLDRDGVINEYPGDFQYVKSWQEFKFLPRVRPALEKIAKKGYKIFIISNQAGVSKNIYSQKELDLITQNMLLQISGSGVDIAGVYYCTHREEENCSCRKPKTGLIEAVLHKLKENGQKVELKKSYFIGDTMRDVETGKNAGLRTILVFSGKEKPQSRGSWRILPDFTAQDLNEAAEKILK